MKTVKTGKPFFWIILLAGLAAALPTRIYELLRLIDPESGFYTANSITTVLLYAVSATVFVLALINGLLHKKGIERLRLKEKNIFLAVCALLFALTLFYDAYNCIQRYVNLSQDYMASNMLVSSNQETMTRSGAIDTLGQALFAALSGIYFLLTALNAFTDRSVQKLRLLALAPVVWNVFKIVYRFMRTISYINVSELFYELLMIAFLLLFFMAYAQLRSGINDKGMRWKLFAYGVPAAFFCLLCFVPRLVLTVTGKGDLLTVGSPLDFCDLGAALLIIAVLSGLRKEDVDHAAA